VVVAQASQPVEDAGDDESGEENAD